MKGRKARKMTVNGWQTDQMVWWRGKAIDRNGSEYISLLRNTYKAMFEQNERFRRVLMATRGMILYHSRGSNNPYKTIITEKEFCMILTEIRDGYDKCSDSSLQSEIKQDEKTYLIDLQIGSQNISVKTTRTKEPVCRSIAQKLGDELQEMSVNNPEWTEKQLYAFMAFKEFYKRYTDKQT